MLKGDLATTPVETILIDLAEERATGCLHVLDDGGREALVYLKAGLVYAMSVPGERPQLGARLISSNALVPEGLTEALEAQRTELQGWRLGELLVHLGFVEQHVVEAFVQEQVIDGFTDLMTWTSGRWRFRNNEKTREDVAPPTAVAELLEAVRDRQAEWAQIVGSVHGPNAVPTLATHGGEADAILDPDAWSLLCKIDNERSVAELARECGLTLFEAGNVVRGLVEAGLVEVDEDVGPDDDREVSLPSGGDTGAAPVDDLDLPMPGWFDADTGPADDRPSFDDTPALLRVTEALSKAFSLDPVGFVDPFHVPDEIRLRPTAAKAPQVVDPPSEEEQRRERIRQAAAAELAAAHAEAEAMRKQPPQRVAEVVDLEARREAARADADRRETERLAAETAQRKEAERLEAERLEAERLAAEAAERLEAERLEAERLAAEEAAKEEADRAAARAAAERALTEAAEHAAAEEAAAANVATWLDEADRLPANANHSVALDAAPYTDSASATRLADASALLSELSRTGATDLEAEPDEQAAGAANATDFTDADDDDEDESDDLPEPIVQRDLTDTASLLRELSSLGFDDDSTSRPSNTWSAPSAPRPVTATPPKKKRGLFGR